MIDRVIRLDARGIRSLCWAGDTLIDWAGGGRVLHLDGSVQGPRVNYAFRFDAAVASPCGKFAVIYEKLGTKGRDRRTSPQHGATKAPRYFPLEAARHMKHLIWLLAFFSAAAYAGDVRVFNSEAEIPANCQPRIGIFQLLTFSPKETKQGLEKLEIRVLKECTKSTKRVHANAFLLKGFQSRDEGNGAVTLRCDGTAYQCK